MRENLEFNPFPKMIKDEQIKEKTVEKNIFNSIINENEIFSTLMNGHEVSRNKKIKNINS